MVEGYIINPSTLISGRGRGSLSSKPAWPTEWVPGYTMETGLQTVKTKKQRYLYILKKKPVCLQQSNNIFLTMENTCTR